MKIHIKYLLLILAGYVSYRGYVIYDTAKEIKKIYQNCYKIKNGMHIYDVYKQLDSEINPELQIKQSSSGEYRHYIYYPGRLFQDEYGLLIEFDNQSKKVVNFPDSCSICRSCP